MVSRIWRLAHQVPDTVAGGGGGGVEAVGCTAHCDDVVPSAGGGGIGSRTLPRGADGLGVQRLERGFPPLCGGDPMGDGGLQMGHVKGLDISTRRGRGAGYNSHQTCRVWPTSATWFAESSSTLV
jgi:hypothetical protein